ncbi:Protein FMP32, mitochondrial [Sphaceloma murrayae]|uniref:Protein FMP32, mitochondrial n=1 Tax=Sphaceloma murrayae TaxID=2082308 RepID=A0A2K1QRL3_9PEZI|nr:Protein FMP32, mitochondrial [Sphaceloma murrayae]
MAVSRSVTAAIPRFLLPRLSWTPISETRTCLARGARTAVTPRLGQRYLSSAGHGSTSSHVNDNSGTTLSSKNAQSKTLAWQRRWFSATSRRSRDHHFDTLKFVQRLQEEGFSEEQAVALMKILGDVVEESISNLTRTMVLREDQEKATYTQKVDFAKLRSELLSADSTESSLTRTSHEKLTNDLTKLNSRLRDEIQRTQASVRLDLNLEKGRIREEANSQELKIKEVETRIEQETAALRERLEQVKFSTLQWLMGVCTGTAAIILGVWRLLM